MTVNATTRTWCIPEASTGFGRLPAEEVLGTGDRVVLERLGKHLASRQTETAAWEPLTAGVTFPEAGSR